MLSLDHPKNGVITASRVTGYADPASSNLFDFHLILFTLFIALPLIDPVLRYAKYTLPIIALLTLLISSRFESARSRSPSLRTTLDYFHRWSIFYLLLIAYSFCVLATTGDLFFRFFANCFFMVSPVLAMYLVFHYFDPAKAQRYVRTLFWGFVIIFCLWKISVIPALRMELLIEALFTSQFPSENHLAFHFGLLSVYFVLSKNLRYSVGAAIMTILCFKRIVFPAVILSVLICYLFDKAKLLDRKWKYAVIFVSVFLNLFAVHLSYQFAFGEYDYLITMLTDTSPNAFFMGRQFIYSNVLSQINGIPWLGIGIGKIDQLSFTLFNHPLNLHSDLLKNYFEFGTLFFVPWVCLLYFLNSASARMIALTIYMNTIFLTDNAFVYFDVVYVFYLLSGILLHEISAAAKEKPIIRHP